MENLDDYLEEGASAEERQAAEQVLTGLDTIRLEEKIKRAAAQRKRLAKIKRTQQIGIILLALLIVAGLYWRSTQENEAPNSQSSIEQPTTTEEVPTESPPIEENTTPTLEEEPASEPEEPVRETPPQRSQTPDIPIESLPIAQADPLPDPSYAAPSTFLRGQNNEVDSMAKARLNQLWYTSYPLAGLEVADNYQSIDSALSERNFTQAFIRLQRAERTVEPNDTLRYLQAYTLLEMGEGAEAIRILDAMETPSAEWEEQMEWYRALANLLSGEEDAAKEQITRIAAKESHSYKQAAQKAKRLYDWE